MKLLTIKNEKIKIKLIKIINVSLNGKKGNPIKNIPTAGVGKPVKFPELIELLNLASRYIANGIIKKEK